MNKIISKDKNAEDVLGFLVAKGLLFAPDITLKHLVKLNIKEVIRIGLEIEPRVLEVLPAALLRFPKSFTNLKHLPNEIKIVLDHIKADKEKGPNLAGIKYKDMKKWANMPLKDQRVVPVNKKRKMKSVRLSPDALKILKNKAKEEKISETEYLENLILKSA